MSETLVFRLMTIDVRLNGVKGWVMIGDVNGGPRTSETQTQIQRPPAIKVDSCALLDAAIGWLIDIKEKQPHALLAEDFDEANWLIYICRERQLAQFRVDLLSTEHEPVDRYAQLLWPVLHNFFHATLIFLLRFHDGAPCPTRAAAPGLARRHVAAQAIV
jgi:hypothetical protein